MINKLSVVTILVNDQDEALAFYTEKLGFIKVADDEFGPGARWVSVAPAGQSDLQITLQKPQPALHGEENAKRMEEMVGRNPTWSFQTEDCRKSYEELQAQGVKFHSPPTEMPYGIEAVFEDLYGNSFSLLEPAG